MLERSGILADGDGGWYYQTVNPALKNESATFEALHVLAKDVGVRGVVFRLVRDDDVLCELYEDKVVFV